MRLRTLALGLSILAAWAAPAAAQTPGVTATEIKIGSTQPLSGPASAYGVVAASTEAYFTRLNEAGGIHGRKITWLPMDDAFTPAKTVEQTRKLVEQEGVFMIFAPQGTAASSSVWVTSKPAASRSLASASSAGSRAIGPRLSARRFTSWSFMRKMGDAAMAVSMSFCRSPSTRKRRATNALRYGAASTMTFETTSGPRPSPRHAWYATSRACTSAA